mmetsp:Transcript_18834/g.35890  ORF Transcript_18834/g.35890 Transcript_18834/m.35890 type:complete len:221 (+) Transcript_18834:940-1602(+)
MSATSSTTPRSTMGRLCSSSLKLTAACISALIICAGAVWPILVKVSSSFSEACTTESMGTKLSESSHADWGSLQVSTWETTAQRKRQAWGLRWSNKPQPRAKVCTSGLCRWWCSRPATNVACCLVASVLEPCNLRNHSYANSCMGGGCQAASWVESAAAVRRRLRDIRIWLLSELASFSVPTYNSPVFICGRRSTRSSRMRTMCWCKGTSAMTSGALAAT